MTDAAALSQLSSAAPVGPEFPPVKPRWLGPAATVAAVLAHVGVAVFLMTAAIEKIQPLELCHHGFGAGRRHVRNRASRRG